ncbi:cytochrome b5 domain-containing protein [Candidatus Falkowbacteria bacterium]|nr:cytochrome b5 domain-containing protein [Candidatus Falkowbacteria bacterium]
MKTNSIIIAVAVILLVFIGGYFFMRTDKGVPSTTNQPNNAVGQVSKAYGLDEVAKHSTANDCWLAIEGKVYDATGYIAGGKHPGGEAILSGCGKDATVLFNSRPMGSGTPHSDKARSFLPNFLIGSLATNTSK